MAVRELMLINDQALLDRARHGDVAAHDELWRRWGPTTWRLAVAVTRDPAAAEAITASGWASVVASPAAVGSATPVGPLVLAAVRQAALTVPLEPAPPTPLAATLSPDVVQTAFAELPERLRSAAWLIEVEGLEPRDVAAALQVPAAALPALRLRARGALAERVVALAASSIDPAEAGECQRVIGRLTDYADGRLTSRETSRVRRHLDGCERCESILGALDDLIPALHLLAIAWPADLSDAARNAWRASLVQERGPLHLMLFGQPVPPWAERVLAGAAAAVVAFGVSTAVILAGRSDDDDDRLSRQDAQGEPFGTPDGESALGSQIPSLDSLPVQVSGGGLTGSGSDASGSGSSPVAVGSPTVPRGAPTSPIDEAPPAPTPPGTQPPVTPEPESTLQVGINLPGVVEVAVGEDCTGVAIAGTVVGCDPPESESLVDLGGGLLGG